MLPNQISQFEYSQKYYNFDYVIDRINELEKLVKILQEEIKELKS